ncbi:MAG: ABC transporter substrate-binding protein [Gammaproteobacteria bacterium]|nr:ABC transporter substrate-binding protein [Gammaproteobacteria bacterium]
MLASALLCCNAPFTASVIAAEVDTASARLDSQQKIEAFHEQLLTVMQITDGFDVRLAAFSPTIHELFDVATISRISLGRTWKSLDESARQTFIELLERLIVATYVARFDDYNGQTFQTINTEQTRRGWVVKTELALTTGDKVRLDYYLREGFIYNVVADGVSDLSLRRADYNSIIKSEGFAALLMHLSENIEEQIPRE